jgi:hypothetical protein
MIWSGSVAFFLIVSDPDLDIKTSEQNNCQILRVLMGTAARLLLILNI